VDDRDVDLSLSEVFKRNAPSFDVEELAPIDRPSRLQPTPKKARRGVLRRVAFGAAFLVLVAAVGVSVWQVLDHLGPHDRVVVITDDTGAPTTASSSLMGLSDGEWELQVDRAAWLDNVRLPSDQLSDTDYHPITDGPTFMVTAFEDGAKVAIKGQGAVSELEAEGTRTSVDRSHIWYNLDPAPGGRLVVSFTYEGTQAEFTEYGSGRPMIFSYRGRLVRVQSDSTTDTTATTDTTESAGLYPVLVEGKWGFIDKTGALKIQPQFAGICRRDGDGMLFGFSEGLAPAQAVTNGPRGYIDTSGHMVIEPQFSLAQPFSEGFAVVRRTGSYFFIDKLGNTSMGPYIGAMDFSGGLAFVDDGGRTGFIDTEGAWMPDLTGPDGVRLSIRGGFSEGLAMVQAPEGGEGSPASLTGYVDESGALAIEPRFNRAADFSEGLAAVGTGESDDVMKYGYIDKTGAWVIQPQFEEAGPVSEGLAAVGIRDAKGAVKYGYINTAGTRAVPLQFNDARAFSEGLALVWWTSKCAYIDKTGAVAIPLQYQLDGWDFTEGVVRVGGGFGPPSYIDTTGKVIWPKE